MTAGAAGVFRSVDGGRSWSGLNEGLAESCAATRLLDLPAGDQGVRIALHERYGGRDGLRAISRRWIAGEQLGPGAMKPNCARRFPRCAASNVTALAIAGDFIYTGMQNGDDLVSADRGLSWQTFSPGRGLGSGGTLLG